jgi:hypothetical protein
MHRYLAALDENQPQRSVEEYLGAFTESLKLIEQQSPLDRIGHAVLLAAKTALRLKAALPSLKEHEIANRLQAIARNIRLGQLLRDLTPEEKGWLKAEHARSAVRRSRPAPTRRAVKPRRRG